MGDTGSGTWATLFGRGSGTSATHELPQLLWEVRDWARCRWSGIVEVMCCCHSVTDRVSHALNIVLVDLLDIR
jgi:hypothetical protein